MNKLLSLLILLLILTLAISLASCADHSSWCRSYDTFILRPNAKVSWETYREYQLNCTRPPGRLSY